MTNNKNNNSSAGIGNSAIYNHDEEIAKHSYLWDIRSNMDTDLYGYYDKIGNSPSRPFSDNKNYPEVIKPKI